MRAHLEQQRGWLTVERLPAYAPELNPVEYLWANLKAAAGTVGEVADQASTTSGGRSAATAWSSGSSPIPACPSMIKPSPQRERIK
jgi:hypothetical protein